MRVCLQRLQSGTRGPRLSEDAFEGVIDSFEKGLHHVLEHRTELWPDVIEASREAPDIEGIFPVEEACNLAVSVAISYGLSESAALAINQLSIRPLYGLIPGISCTKYCCSGGQASSQSSCASRV